MDYNKIFKEIAEYRRIKEETEKMLEALTDEVKNYMKENSLDTLLGSEHKATYKEVTSERLDTKALKKELPEVASRYTKTTASMRFNFS